MSWPRRNVALSQPPASTGLTGKPAHWGNCASTSRDTSPAVISAFRTTGLSQSTETRSYRFTAGLHGIAAGRGSWIDPEQAGLAEQLWDDDAQPLIDERRHRDIGK